MKPITREIGPSIPSAPAASRAAGCLALGAVAGPVLFLLASVVLSLQRPGYSLVSQQVSALDIGPYGAFMNAAFVLGGLLVLVGVIAVFGGLSHEMGTVARWACTILLMISPLGQVWAGIFTMDQLAMHLQGAQAYLSGSDQLRF